MGNKNAQGRRMSARRVATFLAALGALVMSSGIALMVTATPANAVAGPSVCHPVNGAGELGNGWNLIPPDQASSHIDDSLYPNGEYWKHESNDGRHDVYAVDGACPGDTPPQATCPEDSAVHAGDPIPAGETEASYCNAVEQATCPQDSTAHAGEVIPEGTTAEEYCNAVVEGPVTCPAGSDKAGQEIPAGETAATFCANASTVVVSPPKTHTGSQAVVKAPKAHTQVHAAAVTPTVVEAGLVSTSVQDLRGEQGLALMVAGMVMLVGAGGLGLRVRGTAARI